MLRKLALLFLFPVFFGLASSAFAQDLDKKVLTVSGNISSDTPVNLSLHELEELPASEIVTATPWHDGVVKFEGVSLDTLLTHLGGEGARADIVALNDYRSVIPISDFKEIGPILAYKANGQYMSVRDKGPLFIIYPFDDDPELKTEIFYSRSVWQVRSIVIE